MSTMSMIPGSLLYPTMSAAAKSSPSSNSPRVSRLSSLNLLMRPSKELPRIPPAPSQNLLPVGLHDSDNFNLTKVDSNTTLGSEFSTQLHYKVTLNLNKKDIELVRYTWHKMLLDEPVVERKSVLPQIPGQFPIEQNGAQNQNKSLRFIQQTSSSTIASSLFCRQLYANLLSMDPTLETLFPSIKHQAVAFAGVMSLAILQLENISNIDDYLMKLGKRHARILSIEAPQFELMGEALIQTFHQRFGGRFNQELEILWIKLYMYLSNSILQYGIDPKLKLNDGAHSHFEHNLVEDEPDTFSQAGSEPITRQTTYSTNAGADTAVASIAATSVGGVSSTVFDRKNSYATQQTSINAPLPPIEAVAGKKKKSRASLRTKAKEGCVMM